MMNLTERKIECNACEGDDECSNHQLFSCDNAIACWKSSVRDVTGRIHHSRGCIDDPDHMQFMCNRRFRKKPSVLDSRFHVECCTENLCNDGAFPILQNPTSDTSLSMSPMMLTVAVLVPVLILGLIVFLVIIWCHCRSKYCYSANKHSVLPENSQTRSEQSKEYNDARKKSANVSIIDSGKISLRNAFLQFSVIPGRFSKTQKYKMEHFNENEESSNQNFKQLTA